jgi:branched-chain amino acid transport system substrate-binding protein
MALQLCEKRARRPWKDTPKMVYYGDTRLTRRSLLQLAGGAGLAALSGPVTGSLAASKPVQLAVIVDTTGAGAVYGTPVLQGMRLAAAEVNARGGIHGHALALKISNGRSDPAHIASLVRAVCHDDSTVALLGPTLSSEAVTVDPIAQAAGLPVIAVSNTVPGLTAIGNYIFRIPLGDDQIIPVVLKAVRTQVHLKRVALLYDHVNAATAGAAKVFQDVASSMGLTVVANETFASGATQFGHPLAAIASARPDAVLVSALAQDAVLILKQRVEAGIPAATPIVGANGLNTPAIIQGAGAGADGVIVGTIFDPSGAWTRNRHFRTGFVNRYHHAPDVFAAQGYDGISTVVMALRYANTISKRRELRTALANLKGVPSVLSADGHFAFTAKREANLAPIVRIVRHEKFVRFP